MIQFIRERWPVMAIAFGALYGAWAFYAQGAVERWQAAVTQEQQLRESQSSEDPIEMLMNSGSNTETAPSGTALASLRFSSSTLTGVQDRVQDLADEAGVAVIRVAMGTGGDTEAIGPVTLHLAKVSIDAEGTFGQIATFLRVLSAAPMATVENFSLSPAGKGRGTRLSVWVTYGRFGDTDQVIVDGGSGGLFE